MACTECLCPSLLHRGVEKTKDTGRHLVPRLSADFQSGWREKASPFRNATNRCLSLSVLHVCRSELFVLFEKREDTVSRFRATMGSCLWNKEQLNCREERGLIGTRHL